MREKFRTTTAGLEVRTGIAFLIWKSRAAPCLGTALSTSAGPLILRRDPVRRHAEGSCWPDVELSPARRVRATAPANTSNIWGQQPANSLLHLIRLSTSPFRRRMCRCVEEVS